MSLARSVAYDTKILVLAGLMAILNTMRILSEKRQVEFG